MVSKKGRLTPARDFIEAAVAAVTDECIVWPFSAGPSGYGQIEFGGKTYRAHRVVCEGAHGPPPFHRANAAHTPLVCANRRCVNPRHLRWATIAENQRDKRIDGTVARGERVYGAKLTPAIVAEIRAAKGTTKAALARRYGVAGQTIKDVLTGRTWSHVPRDE